MTIRSGLGASVGYAAETTYGTYVAPTRHLEFRSEALDFNRDTIQSEGIRRGSTVQRTGRWARNLKGGGGALAFELANKGFGLILKHAMGAAATSTPVGWTNGRRHTLTLGDLDDLSLTIQKGIPDTDDGTVHAYSFLGCVVTDFEIGVDVDGLVLLTVTIDAQTMDPDQVYVEPVFPASDSLFSYQQVGIAIDSGTALATALSLRAGHGLKTDRYFIRQSQLKKRPLIAARRDLAGSLTFEFENEVQADRFLDAAPGAEVDLVVTVTGDEIDTGVSNFGLTATAAAIRFDGELPKVSGPDVVTITAPFEILDNGSDEPLEILYDTTDVAP